MTLYITDLDGTLLGPDSLVSDESARIITDLSRRGALITVATARTPATVEPLLHDTLTTIPAIVLTGASMWDRSRRVYLDPMTLAADTARQLEATFLSHGINPFVYNLHPDGTMQVLHSPAMTSAENRFYDERKALELKKFIFRDGPHCPAGGTDETAGSTVILMLGIGDTPTINRLADTLRLDPQLSVSAYPDIFTPERSYIEVFRAGISKAAAVLRLKKMTGADRLVVYGDHLNDLPMFAVADESVAVANALPEVRAAATRTIGPNTTSSVAHDMARDFDVSVSQSR
ncbi:MAG: HAD family hydrolase [Duncaniella sp.]|nr:HAD family hydrolase [Duncaniella sp.]